MTDPNEVRSKLLQIAHELSNIHNNMFTLDPSFNNSTNGLGTVRVYLSKIIQEVQFKIKENEAREKGSMVKK